MTRSVQMKLFSTENRLTKLKVTKTNGKPKFLQIAVGVLLGYKRHSTTDGKWYGKLRGDLIGMEERYRTFTLGVADDHAEADGEKVLNLNQAQSKLFALKDTFKKNYKKNAISWTFKEATELYHKAYMDRKVRPNETHKHYLDRIMAMEIPYRLQHIKQFKKNTLLANVRLDDITLQDLESIKTYISKTARQNDYVLIKLTDAEKARRRKSTANRFVVIIKAILNHAYTHKRITHVKSNAEWLAFKKFKDADLPRKDWWDADECQAFINKCNEPSLKEMFIGAISCGFRFGEQSMIRVGDVDLNSTTPSIHILADNAKSGKERFVIIPEHYREFYTTLTAGRDPSELLFTYRGGRRPNVMWKASMANGPFHKVREAAGLRRLPWHCLRHSYASQLVNAGVQMKVVADQLGHATTYYVEMWYGHLANKTVYEAVNKLQPMNNIITDRASVVKIKQVARSGNVTPALYDDRAREAVWVKPDDAEEKLAVQNSEKFNTIQRARKRGESSQGRGWKYHRNQRRAANEKG